MDALSSSWEQSGEYPLLVGNQLDPRLVFEDGLDTSVSGRVLTHCIRVLESLKAGRRLPEARFSNMKIAPKGQSSVYGLYSKQSTGS